MPGELQSARAQTSGLNEELGLVKFIAADKTGTLTCNRMDARKAFIGQLQYGTGTTDLQAAVRAAQLASRTKAEIAADDVASFDQMLAAVEEVKLPPSKCAARAGLPPSCAHVNFNARDQVLLSLQGQPAASFAAMSPALLARQQKDVHEYFMCLALCNIVFPTINEYVRGDGGTFGPGPRHVCASLSMHEGPWVQPHYCASWIMM